MTRVSRRFGIPGSVPFVDVHVEQDNYLFLEPSRIRAAARARDPYAQRALATIGSFFDEVLVTVRADERRRGLALMDNLHEPNESRLGMTQVGVAGHGMGAQLAGDLWDKMSTNPACRDAVIVQHIEDLAPFVDGIGPDLISDLLTRITFDVLADFTDEMMTRYPQLISGSTLATERTWDITTPCWVRQPVRLPVADGRRLLLIPTNWVWDRQLFTAPSFYQIQSLGRIQDLLTRPAQRVGGQPIAPRKRDLRPVYPEIRPTNIDQAVAAAGDGISLTVRHAVHVKERLVQHDLTADEINSLI